MPPFFQPDPAHQVAELAAKVEELARIVRKGKEAPNMRDLRDANGQGAAAGDTWVYGEDSVWRPGSAGGAASLFFARGPNVGGGQTVPDGVNTTINFDTIIESSADVAAVPGEPGTYEVQPGYYVVSATIQWEGAGAAIPGLRKLGLSVPGEDTVLTSAEVTNWAPNQALSLPFYTAIADWVYAFVRKDGTTDPGNSTINRTAGHLRILRVG